MADKTAFRMDDNGVITFGTDEKGVAYGPENSPKKSATTQGLWSKYSSGMTVKAALDAGLSRSNIRRDRRAGLINIENPAVAEKPAAEKAPKAPKAPKGTAAAGTEATV